MKRRGAGWRQMFVAAGATMMLQGCADYFTKMAHLKDNPMDQAVATGVESDHMKETRDRLLRRFPIGRPVAPIIRYLERVGAKCRESSDADGTVTCPYSQHMDLVFRTPIGEFPEVRNEYEFRIKLMKRRGLLHGVIVCRRITAIWSKGTLSDRSKRVEYPMKCLEGQNTKEGG